MQKNIWHDRNLISVLKKGGVAVMPTDTIYGLVGKALDPVSVEKIYAIRKRAPDKPCIILIASTEEVKKFSINLSESEQAEVQKYWPLDKAQDAYMPTSIILDCPDEKFSYLHRGTKTLAFRVPLSQGLRDLLKEIGPLIAPSANIENLPPSVNIEDARRYFGNLVDLYIDGGDIQSKPSKVIKLDKGGSVAVLRQ